MEAWRAPEIPTLPDRGPDTGPGRGQPLRVYDTASSALRLVTPGETACLYVCGITPYDATHLGHAATYVAFDLLHRAWRDAGHAVRYVQNVTDVDDPLLQRASETGQDWRELATREIALFRDDMTALRVLPPAHYLGVVEAMPLIIDLVEQLRARGVAYDVDGDTYFAVHADPRFGQVGRLDRAAMLRLSAERGGDPDRPGKKDPLDCLLWQAARPGEPAWDAPWGSGRPGWHVECTAIALTYLGMGVDVQGGGRDLVFPHHEMGASEAHVATGTWPYAQAYVHAGMVAYEGEKMSKSKGNLVLVSTLRADGVDPAAIRLALLAHHYRSDWEWTGAELAAATARLSRWRSAASCPAGPPADELLRSVRVRLADDLDAPGALAAVDGWVAEQEERGGGDPAAPALVSRAVDALLGVRL